MKLGRKWTKIRAKIVSDDNPSASVLEWFKGVSQMDVSYPNISSSCFPAHAKQIGRSCASCVCLIEILRDVFIG